MAFGLMRVVRGAGAAAVVVLAAAAMMSPARAQIPGLPPGVTLPSSTTSAMSCLQSLSAGIVLTDAVVTHFIETYPPIRAELAASPYAGAAQSAAGGPPTYLCTVVPNAATDAYFTPYGYGGFHDWASIMAATTIGMMFTAVDPQEAAMVSAMMGVSSTPGNIAAVAPHTDEIQAVMAGP
jgi:hypothetical protein